MADSKKLVVTAPLVIAKNDEGGDVYVYRGAPVPKGQSSDWLKRHQRDGMIAEVAEDEPVPEPASGEFDAAAFVGRGAEDVRADVAGLSDEDRAAALEAERAGENRVTVVRALGGE